MSLDKKTTLEKVSSDDAVKNGSVEEQGSIVTESLTPVADQPHEVSPSVGDMQCMRINSPSTGVEAKNAVSQNNVENSSLAKAGEVDTIGDDANNVSHVIDITDEIYEVIAARQIRENLRKRCQI